MPTEAPTAPPAAPASMPPAEPLKLTPTGTDPGPSNAPDSANPLDKMMDRIGTDYAVDDAMSTPRTRQAKKVEKPTVTPEPAKKDESKTEGLVEPEKSPAKAEEKVEDKTDAEVSKAAGTAADENAGKGKKEKVNPWKRGDEFKSLYEKSEAEVLRLKKLLPNEKELAAKEEHFTKLEAQNKELLEHIRYLDYQKHPEFKEKYEQPYVDSWNRIMRRLQGVAIQDGDTKRAVEPKDIAELGRLPADQAIELAEQKFGKLGPWVAERVEELRQLDEAKYLALEKAKKEGNDFVQKSQETQTKQQQEMNNYLKETWTKALEEVRQHSKYGKYFNPVEGDDEYNARIEKGNAQVDETLAADPRDPSLTAEQRATIVKRHAAMRNKAAAFGVQNLVIERLEAKLAEVTEKLKQYEASVPKTDGSDPATTPAQSANPWDAFGSRLQQYAK